MSDYTSRFFLVDDEKNSDFFFPLHPTWWSRFYEYIWASKFIEKTDISLDAASGICHPFKFYLADHGQETHALDYDPRILEEGEIKKEIFEVFGATGLNKMTPEYFQKIVYQKASLTKMPYENKKFDKIYCLSVLEHLNDWPNKYPYFNDHPGFDKFIPRNIEHSLREFRRVLKDNGLIILTFDYPTINLYYFKRIIERLNLTFAAAVDFTLPPRALYSPDKQLYCFRAILKKI
ncbi:MAG: class I SAM-dependent methyltransferase [Patescibacteria group bacterium]